MKKLVKVGAVLVSAMPVLALAQSINTNYLTSIINGAKDLLDKLVVVLISLAIVWFIWNVIRYVMSNELEKKDAAKQQMIWGIIGLAVIVSIWGLVALLQNIFGVNTQNAGTVNNLLPRR